MTKPVRIALIFLVLLIIAVGVFLYLFFSYIPMRTESLFGPASDNVPQYSRNYQAFQLYLQQGMLLEPIDPTGDSKQNVRIGLGESASEISERLFTAQLIPDADIFLQYLIYKGYDRILQSGDYYFSTAQTPVSIANSLIDPSPLDVAFNILPGMRLEEIAGLISTSGLSFSQEEFSRALEEVYAYQIAPMFQNLTSLEGLFLGGEYIVLRELTAPEFIEFLLFYSADQFSQEVASAFDVQGLDMYQALILASIIEKEVVNIDEMPLIASVFLNRLRDGMLLQSDPTVQYAIANTQQTAGWWKVDLTGQDLLVDSPYNTYLYAGLPPTPICAVSIDSLLAVAFPSQSDFYYFRSTCYGSGYHQFAVTYEEHQMNACP